MRWTIHHHRSWSPSRKRTASLTTRFDHRKMSHEARAKLPRMTAEIALAHAHFRLGAWLKRQDRLEEGARHMSEASRLHPESWNMWRQAADLNKAGLAAGPAFWERVHALGDKPYHPPPDLPGFPGPSKVAM